MRGQSLVALNLPVTKDMAPSFRIVAYYHVGSSEVVSDSVWVDVKDTCAGKLKLEVKDKMNFYNTGDKVKLQITGDPGARVGLVVVDKAVNVLNKNRLTQTKIWDVIEKHDIGCTAGSGRDSMGVFSDAGLMFESNTAGGTNTRTTLECPFLSKRRRRSLDNEEIVSRTQFYESWLWEDIELCENCPTPVTDKIIFLKDPITTWQIFAVSLSPTLGICVAEPEEMVVFKSFFIDLKMPYSAVRSEQLEIKAIIHNYTKKKLKVRVEFMETEDVCSSASKKGKYRTVVNVDKDSSISVSYVIIPMTLGNHMIEAKASAYDAVHTDGVRKTLKVVPEGVLTQLHRENVELNPLINGEEISQTVEQAISGDIMGPLIVRPTADGESNMIIMSRPLIATHYLDRTNQWETVGFERRNEAINHINTGYQRQLSFRKSDGSYAAWINRPSSTWLTAYVAKVFAMAHDLIVLDDNVICSAFKWLILNKQLQDGSFKEDTAVIHGEMVGDVRGKDADASLTAFVLIAMQEGREICAGSVGSLNESMRKAVSFLEGRLPKLTNPYAVAMTSYAMANADKLNKDILMRHSTQGEASRSWAVPGKKYHSLEATAYAVLALVKAKDFDKAGEAVRWLKRQQTHYGGSGTTQMDINKDFNVTARGTGTATLSILTLYYARPVEKKSDCTFFDLTVKMEKDPKTKQGAIETYQLTMNFLYKSDKSDATMTVLDIGIPTGFTVDGEDLEVLSTEKERCSQKFEMDKVILYLNKVSRKQEEVISFKMHKLFNVGLLQPAAVTIYEYYSTDARCTKFYHPERTGGALNRLCKGDLCYCAEENCSYQKKNGVSDQERFDRSCEAGVNYVYKVTVVWMDLQQTVDIYDMKVEQVLKEGTDDNVEGKVRQFLARPICREHLGLVKGKSYLIIGKSVDLPNLGGSVQYILGEQTWVEYWPTQEESQTPEHRERYMGISELQDAKRCCSKQEKDGIRNLKRLEKACEDDKGYAYKVTVVGTVLDKTTDIYSLQVELVLRNGTDNDGEGQLKIFQAHPRCRESLALQEHKSYLIMGPFTDMEFRSGRLQYVFGVQTWVEYWPTKEESQTPEHMERYVGISKLADTLAQQGCVN
ncbi:complement C3-like protein [Labeo rohita]|uniref:Complement C3-like protein n=1 Tax=Labeo rohita TaxID=84645 RepID=A0A498MDY3_LABRO|nr:complement C3-like protein [Labeo rohita]